MTSIPLRIEQAGIVAVLVVDDHRAAPKLARTLLDAGICAMELTLRTPAALDALRAIRTEVPAMLAGVGTILTPAQVREALAAGAEFGVAPGFNPRVVRSAQDAGLAFSPGIATPSDIEGALELDCRLLKFFPAEPSGGLPYLTNMAAPYLHCGVRFIPLGGINAKIAPAWLASPLIAALGGSWIAPREAIAAVDWTTIGRNAAEAATIVQSARAAPHA
jgi:2-dehydro-3-deoxyphosphogluconate aldolase/(4S)-4-hydroxy-2-oxoglutarate aldolase